MYEIKGTWSFIKGFSEEYWNKPPEKMIPFTFDKENRIDLDTLLEVPGKQEDEGFVVCRFMLEKAQPLAFGTGCDWWFEVRLNGKKLYSTFPGGNASSALRADDHGYAGQGKAGENCLAFHVRRGRGTWFFAVQEADPVAADPCLPITIDADAGKTLGPVKPMNAVNNGPIRGRSDQSRGNFELWKTLEIPFARNHDAAFCSAYGGEHAVDIHAVFPDFSADPEDPASYDFALTDDCVKNTLDAGTETFYRLGSKIEHNRRKYGTKVPPDFRKWAVICEHIIRHYNEGWADGFHWNILYWEIWNEPDLDADDAKNKRTWQGTEKQFFELYRIAATHLKQCFPSLKIGGPAISGRFPWMERFLKQMHEWNVPIDFFSWHAYRTRPETIASSAELVRAALDAEGYGKTESILNEWNYVRDWGAGFCNTIRTIIGLKGAIFTASCMCAGQNSPVDMLMYYDARPCAFNGIFDFYTYSPLKTFYAFKAWQKLAALGKQFPVDTKQKNGIFAVGAADGKGRAGILLCRYFETDDLPGPLEITLDAKGLDPEQARVLLLDADHDLTEVSKTVRDGKLCLVMEANTLVCVEY